MTTATRIGSRLRDEGARGRDGWGVLRQLLVAPAVESVLERRLLTLLKRARLPRPQTQHRVHDGRRMIARVDFAYPAARVVIEADSWRYHSGSEAFHRDLARRNALTAADWTVLHATWADLERPEALIRSIEAALAGAGAQARARARTSRRGAG